MHCINRVLLLLALLAPGAAWGQLTAVTPDGTDKVPVVAMACVNSSWQATVCPTGSGTGGGPVTAILGAFVDGSITTLGLEADVAWSGSGSATLIAINKALYTLMLATQATVAPGAAPAKSIVAGCVYNTTLPTFTAGQTGAISCDANGQPYVHPNGGNQAVTLTASTTNGVIPGAASALINGASSAMATSVKASAGQLYGYTVSNAGSGAVYFRLFNLSAAPTVGTSTPYRRVLVPAGATVSFATDIGIAFGTGIAIDVTTGSLADADTTTIATANTVAVTLDLK